MTKLFIRERCLIFLFENPPDDTIVDNLTFPWCKKWAQNCQVDLLSNSSKQEPNLFPTALTSPLGTKIVSKKLKSKENYCLWKCSKYTGLCSLCKPVAPFSLIIISIEKKNNYWINIHSMTTTFMW